MKKGFLKSLNIDPFGLKKGETTPSLLSTLPSTQEEVQEIKQVECEMQGGIWKFDTCVYDFGFGETVEVIGQSIGDENGLSDEDIKKYLPDEFFEEFNLIPFDVWAAQYSMHKAWEFIIPNYKDLMVQIMAQVCSDVQPWLDYGELYLDLTLSMIPIGKSLIPFKFVYKIGVPGKEPVHIGLDYARKNIIHYGTYISRRKAITHLCIWFNQRGTAWKHIYFYPFRILP